ncbi:MAG TPA: hypothetical protein VHZ55_21810, partial [Bryobacteraceae bacterium]|nr:hypothetical protein [Bryobacteraceae bacterium]
LTTWRWARKVFHRVIESTPFGKKQSKQKSRESAPLARMSAVDRNLLDGFMYRNRYSENKSRSSGL